MEIDIVINDLPRNTSNSVFNNNTSKRRQHSISPRPTNHYPNTSRNHEIKMFKNDDENDIDNDKEMTTNTNTSTSSPATRSYTNTSSITSITVGPTLNTASIIQLPIVKALNKEASKPHASQESFSLSNPTPTPLEIQRPTSPIPQFTPFCDSIRGVAEILPFETGPVVYKESNYKFVISCILFLKYL